MGSPTPAELLIISGRTAIVYVVLVILVRLSGKRQIGQMTPFDLVVLLLLSNAVQNAMTGPDTSVAGGIVAACTLLALNFVTSYLRLNFPNLRRLLVGVPVVLIQDGHVQFQALQHEQMTMDDLTETLREHDCANIKNVAVATLEVDGEVSVVRHQGPEGAGFVKTKRKLVRHHKK